MASLTDQLKDSYRGMEVQAPVKPGPSIWEGLATLTGNVIEAHQGAQSTRSRQEANARQARKDALDASDRGAENDLAQGLATIAVEGTATDAAIRDATEETNKVVPGTAYGTSVGVADDTDSRAAVAADGVGVEATKYMTAVEQGRMNETAYNLKMHRLIAGLMAKYPDSKAVIWEQLQQRGINHPLLAEWKRANDAIDTATKEQVKQELADARYYEENFLVGVDDPNADFETKVREGLKKRYLDNERESIAKQAERARQQIDFDDKKADRTRVQATQAMVAAWETQLTPKIGESNQLLMQLVLDPGLADAAKIESLGRAVNAYRSGGYALVDQVIADTKSRLKGDYDAATLDAMSQRMKKQIDEVLMPYDPSNPLNVIQANATQLKMITDATGLGLTKAAPLLMALKQKFPNSEILTAQIETLMADPKITKQINMELRNISAYGDPTSKVHLMNAINMVTQGNFDLRDLSPSEGAAALNNLQGFLTKTTRTAAASNDPTAHDPVVRGIGQVANVAIDLNPGSNPDHVKRALLLMANQNTAQVLVKAAKNSATAELAGNVGDGVRAATQKNIINLSRQATQDPYYSVVFNEKRGEFEAKWNGRKVTVSEPLAPSNSRFAGLPAPGRGTSVQPTMSKDVAQRVRTLNYALNFMVSTGQFEDDLPITKWTAWKQKKYYATGIAPVGKTEPGKKGPSTEETLAKIEKYWTGFKVDWSKVKPITEATAIDARGLGDSLLDRIKKGEAGPKGYDSYYGDGQGKGGSDKFNYGLNKPVTQMTIGEAIEVGRNVMIPMTRGKIGHSDPRLGTSAVGAYQITQETLAEFGPSVFGDNWQSVVLTPENQDKLAKKIIEATGGDPDKLIGRWPSLRGKV